MKFTLDGKPINVHAQDMIARETQKTLAAEMTLKMLKKIRNLVQDAIEDIVQDAIEEKTVEQKQPSADGWLVWQYMNGKERIIMTGIKDTREEALEVALSFPTPEKMHIAQIVWSPDIAE